MNAEERRFAVLRAIVADYVRTQEPVGSKALVDRHNLGVSSATVRNDMAVLEDEGYIAQPHTSAGRVPTDKGYRLFVDRLAQVKPLSAAERRAIQAFLDGAVDLDDVLRRSVRLLAQLTRQVAVVQYPTLTRSTVRHLELVPLTPARLMLVLITDTGRVDQRVVDLGEVLSEADVAGCAACSTARWSAGRSPRPRRRVAELPLTGAGRAARRVVTVLSSVLIETLVEHPEERLVLGGTANLTRNARRLPRHRCGRCWRRWRSRSWCSSCSPPRSDPGTVTVRIGEENESEQMRATSVVSIGYGAGTVLGGHGRRRADPDGLPRHDRGGARGRPLRR